MANGWMIFRIMSASPRLSGWQQQIRSIERRKMWFDIEVNDEKGKCGEGSHLRIMVNSKAMSDKAASKAE